MRATVLLLVFVTACCSTDGLSFGHPTGMQETAPSPFVVSIIPAWSGSSGRGISMAANTLDTFYVLLTNVSKQDQAVFESWNSWGFYAISFELRTDDGSIVAISKKPTVFTMNFPSTFVISPGEQMVYPIELDKAWDATSSLPTADEQPVDVTVKAIYEIKPTRESTQQHVWTGRGESMAYHFKLRHWAERAATSKR